MPANGEPTSTTLHSVALAIPVASGPHETLAGVDTHTFSIRDGVVVLKMPKPLEGFDVVIGMDVLIDFRLTMHNGVFTITRPPDTVTAIVEADQSQCCCTSLAHRNSANSLGGGLAACLR